MSCCGQHKDRDGKPMPPVDSPNRISPGDPCVFCAYKHFHTARRLAEEPFYTAKNRGDIVGELVLAQWHLWKLNHLDLCRQLRDARHLVEHFREKEIDWTPMIEAFDAILTAENDLEKQQTDKKEE